MGIISSASRKGRQGIILLLVAMLALFGVLHAEAVARQPLAVILVDARTGKVLYAKDADAPRYPASITKVMTLYLLFRELKAGRISLNTRLKVSRRASLKPPSKLWLKPGQTITVDQAIRALAVKSANDVAAVVAENLAGSESAFAKRMTAMARALGMTRTVFRNASGLPHPPNVTTARDLATLSLRLMRDFPGYYRKYFGLRYMVWRGRRHRNHNHLLWRVRGMDGIKTGYTRAAGSNLAASVRRGAKRVVAVVLGAPSSRWRNAYMARLLNKAFRRYRLASGSRIAALAGRPPGYSVANVRTWAAKAARMGGVAWARTARAKAAARRQNFKGSSGNPVVRVADVHVPRKEEAKRLAMLARMAVASPVAQEGGRQRRTEAPVPVRPRPRPATIARRMPSSVLRQEIDAGKTRGNNTGVAVLKKASGETVKTASKPVDRPVQGEKAIPALTAAVAVRVPEAHAEERSKAPARNARPMATAETQGRVGADVVIREQPLPDAPPVRLSSAVPEDVGVVVITRKPAPVRKETIPNRAAPPVLRASTAEAATTDGAVRKGEEIIAGRPDLARQLMAARWLIQIGAFPTLEGAKRFLVKARRATRHVHGRYPVVIRVHKGNAAFYRARYAGFSRKDAIRACRELKRKGISCLPMAPGAG